MAQQVEMPENETAWLRDNARNGATIITQNGVRNAYLGVPVTYGDPDKGWAQYPLFAPTDTPQRKYHKRQKMNGLD